MKGEHSKATSYGQTTSTKSSNPVAFSKQGSKPANSNVATADKTKRRPSNKRRTGDGRLFAQMTESQLRAAERIALGFKLRTAGLGFRTQSFSRQPTATGNTGARHLELMQGFMGWAVHIQKRGLSLAAALDILVFGKSCRAVDKARRKRNGFAKKNLMESLHIFENQFL